MMKLFSEAPRDDEDWLVIRDNLLLFADLCSGDNMTPRALLYSYSTRSVFQLMNLRKATHTDSACLLVVLSDIVADHEFRYMFGKKKLADQLKCWRSTELAREQSARVPDEIHIAADELLARVQRKTQFQQVHPSEQEEFEPAPGPSGLQKIAPRPTLDKELEPEQEQNVFQLTVDQSMEIEIGAEKFTVPPGTPVKMTPAKKRRTNWSHKMKVQLLQIWIEKATNPLKRPKPSEGARSRAVYRKDPNMQELYHNSTITTDDGRHAELSSLCQPDYVHNCLASGKLTNQPSLSLVRIIDEVMDGEDRTAEKLEEK